MIFETSMPWYKTRWAELEAKYGIRPYFPERHEYQPEWLRANFSAESIYALAKICPSPKDFMDLSPCAYRAAVLLGIWGRIFDERAPLTRDYARSCEDCRLAARGTDYVGDAQFAELPAEQLDFDTDRYIKWPPETEHQRLINSARDEAVKYRGREHLKKMNPNLWKSFVWHDIVEEVFEGLPDEMARAPDAAEVKARASEFASRTAFAKGDPGAYLVARKLGVLDEVFGATGRKARRRKSWGAGDTRGSE